MAQRIRVVFCALCFITFVCADFGGLSRGVAAIGGCQNTVSGRWHMADDQGHVCPRSSFDYTSGCCQEDSPQYDCNSCTTSDGCCSSYEHCVSCCMSPSHDPEQRMTSAARGLGRPETGQWSSPFQYCRSTCRTTSRSTQHENAFIDERRFCFSEGGRPLTPAPPLPTLPEKMTVIKGDPGASCETTCHRHQRVCAPAHFGAVNDCNTLRNFFVCEAGCGVVRGEVAVVAKHGEFPGYVKEDAPKPMWPAFCFTRPIPVLADAEITAGAYDAAQFNCTQTNQHVRRLCVCEEVPGLLGQAMQVDGLSERQDSGGAAAGDRGGGLVFKHGGHQQSGSYARVGPERT